MTFITLTLLITLAQQPQTKPPTLPPDHRVALMFCETCEPVLVDVRQARRLYRETRRRSLVGWLFTEEQNARVHAALTQALGTLPEYERLTAPGAPGSRERLDWEVRRGVRLPTQSKEEH